MDHPNRDDAHDRLLENAERSFRLAHGTADEQARAALLAYGRELLEEAKALLKDPKKST